MNEGMLDIPEVILADSDSRESREKQDRTSRHSNVSIRLDLQWKSENASHADTRIIQKANLWRDIFPMVLESELLDKPIGHRITHDFASGELLDAYRQSECFSIKDQQFNRAYRRGIPVEPRSGRFYPKGFIAGVRGIYPEDLSPFRVARCGDELTVDLNHPLAANELTLGMEILDIWGAGEEHGGACQDIVELATLNGPGMQARWNGQPTDFWEDSAFNRMADDSDRFFYQMPRMVDHLDSTALRQIEQLYGRLIPKGGAVLDLMSSWKSHLPDALAPTSVVGLGMNQEELSANPQLTEMLVHDLNADRRLPFADGQFDAVVCTVSIEYLIHPLEIFTEVHRVLKTGGKFIVTFSNRWFSPKAIQIWQNLHEFERPGMVLEYFLRVGGFTNLSSWSLRGLSRPVDDKYAGQQQLSDPVHAVWGEKV